MTVLDVQLQAPYSVLPTFIGLGVDQPFSVKYLVL
jgi:hypothetical protein